MSWFKKKSESVNERAEALSSEIAALEAEIKKLDQQLQRRPASLPLPPAPRLPADNPPVAAGPATPPGEPVFEVISQQRISVEAALPNAPEHYNEFGVRKYDFPALLQSIKAFFTGPNTSNPRLVSYLAAGGVQGLRPLRKEKRVARNRFLFFTTILFVVLFGTLWWYLHRRG